MVSVISTVKNSPQSTHCLRICRANFTLKPPPHSSPADSPPPPSPKPEVSLAWSWLTGPKRPLLAAEPDQRESSEWGECRWQLGPARLSQTLGNRGGGRVGWGGGGRAVCLTGARKRRFEELRSKRRLLWPDTWGGGQWSMRGSVLESVSVR